jgi:bis(5'-nucleosidyl)-tetraphosphatase
MKHLYSAGIIPYAYDTKTDELLYLLLHYTAGHWDFPKGKMEKDETKEDAALRELHEETGLSATLDDNFLDTIAYIFTDYDTQLAHKTVYFFMGKATGKEVILSDEHIGFAWLSYKDALATLTYDNAKKVLKNAHKQKTASM